MARPRKAPDERLAAVRRRRILVASVLGVVVLGSVGGAILLSRDTERPKPPTPQPHLDELGVPAAQAGCKAVERPRYQGRIKIEPGQTHPPYSSTPPSSGWYIPGLPGFYAAGQPVERLISIPANGGVGVWVSESEAAPARRFYNLAHRNDLVVFQDPTMPSGAVFVAWGLLQRCERFSGEFLEQFLAQHADSKALRRADPTASPFA